MDNPQLATGVPVTINPGEYDTIEKIPEDPEGLFFVESELSTDCSSNLNGPILVGEERECTITNTYAPDTVAVLKVITSIECEEGQECPSLPDAGIVSVTVIGNNPNPASFSGSANGVLVTLGPGNYFLSVNSPNPPGLAIVGFRTSDCSFGVHGPISAGEARTCTMHAIYAPR